MTERVLDFSEQPAHLSVRNDLLVIDCAVAALSASPGGADWPPQPAAGEDPSLGSRAGTGATGTRRDPDSGLRARKVVAETVPLEDIAVIVASHPRVTFTLAVVASLARHGGLLVTCDEKRQPAALMLPLETHHIQTVRFAAQARLPLPARKRLWQQIVRAKIKAQARLLEERTGKDWGVGMIAARVRSGDPQNLEAHAARIYWPRLLGESFRRSPEATGVNSLLNYGYAVLRAAVARAICAAGLHPTFGLHHRNRYDAFCLADDLMEPFRPLVDEVVARLLDERGESVALDRESKRALIERLLGRFTHEQESRTLFDWLARMAFSLAAVVGGEAARIEIPDLALPGRQARNATVADHA